MQRDSGRRPSRYHILVLSLWEVGGDYPGDSSKWRFSLENARKAERKGFKGLAELMTYLETWTQDPIGGSVSEVIHQFTNPPVYQPTNLPHSQGEPTMERRIINPWTWQDEFGYVQANEVSGVQRTLYCSGQAANDAQGDGRACGRHARPNHPGPGQPGDAAGRGRASASPTSRG